MNSLKNPLPNFIIKRSAKPNVISLNCQFQAYLSRFTLHLHPLITLHPTFSNSEPAQLTQLRPSCYATSPSVSSESHTNHEPIDTHSSSSSAESKPFSKTRFNGLIFLQGSTRIGLFSSTTESTGTPLSSSSKQLKPAMETGYFDQNSRKWIQSRFFSSEISDPNPKPPLNAIHVSSTVNSPEESTASIDAGSSMRKPISLWPGMYHSPVTNALWEARSRMFEKFDDKLADEDYQDLLVAKPPSRSRTSILYKFSSDYVLREQYRNPWNEIRIGKFLEDLDALAGTISFKHCSSDDGLTRPIILVTASVDRMVLKKPIRIDTDLKVVGAVTWVGRSSMEIQMEVIQPTEDTADESESIALVANFTFVARDSRTGKSAPINQILPESDHEKLLWKEAEERNKMRKQKRADYRSNSGNEDVERLNKLLAEGRIFYDMPALADRDSILISNTCHEKSLICQPQQRNVHGRIFGGFLMRKAFELAFSNAYAFAGAAPRFVEVDHVDFLKPVDVGNFLRLKSCVLYTELDNPAEPLINVEVIAHVTSPELRFSEVSNKFYFTFTVRPEAMKDGVSIRKVVPATEEEARRVLERMDAERCQLAKP